MTFLDNIFVRIASWLLAIFVFCGRLYLGLQPRPAPEELNPYPDHLNSALLNLDIAWAAEQEPSLNALGGGLGLRPDGIFAAQKAEEGDVFFLPTGETALHDIGIKLPASNRSLVPTETPTGQRVDPNLLRFNDLATIRQDDSEQLLASYTYYQEAGRCCEPGGGAGAAGRLARQTPQRQ